MTLREGQEERWLHGLLKNWRLSRNVIAQERDTAVRSSGLHGLIAASNCDAKAWKASEAGIRAEQLSAIAVLQPVVIAAAHPPGVTVAWYFSSCFFWPGGPMPTSRNEFFRLIAAAATAGFAPNAAAQQTTSATERPEQFAVRVGEEGAAALRYAMGYIGDQLGIFNAMAKAGPVSAAGLAARTGLNARMLREWLNAMATGNYVEYRPTDKTYFLSNERASVLSNEDTSPMFSAAMFQLQVGLIGAAPAVASAMKSGKPVSANQFSADVYVATERAFAPGYRNQLVQTWIPLLPHVQRTLASGGAAADLGCGSGMASVVMARAFPRSQFAGYDPHAPSIRRARQRAARDGVSDRVRFVAADASKLPQGTFDLITIFHVAHHLSDSVGTLKHCRRALKPDGTCFVVDWNISPDPEQNMNAVGRFVYAASTLLCL